MSGIYLTVWDDVKEFDRVLKSTSGGCPHITLAYTGKHLTTEELKDVAKKAIDTWGLTKITLSHAYVNTFYHERSGQHRHDVLIAIEEVGKVEQSRDELLRKPFPDRCDNFYMREPHVTVKICWTKDEAETESIRINHLLPLQVEITGVTIN